MEERATVQAVEYVPLKVLEAILRARIGWVDAAVSPFAFAYRNRRRVVALNKRPTLPAPSSLDELRLVG